MIKDRLREARKAAGLTQAELAEKLEVPQTSVARWENGKRVPAADALKKLCIALDVSADYILGL